ncbi:MAG TPA: prepilin-type N-terminal cleavage/methylation domain-containing protein [Gemmatimonadaceae bacterium]|nr:prepilin-type N-terminal cleavage/methylation domain-containing protein [Gemmatimonadaceae bacterium]
MQSREHETDDGPPARGPRAGLSVVEVLVALVLLAVGLLGVAGQGAIAMRASSTAARERRAAQRAADRVALLRAQGCGAASSGAAVDPAAALSEAWTVGPAGSAVPIDVEIRWRAPAGPRTLLLRSGMLC